MRTAKLSPSLFAANIFDMKNQIKILQNNHVDLLHVDVMDGNFVSRMAFGADHIRMLKENTDIPLDVHMMVINPEKHLEAVIAAGADIITIHQEATNCLYHCLQTIKKAGRKAGVVLSPATHPANIEYVLDVVDMILIMTVNPGEGGQKFLPDMLIKLGRCMLWQKTEISILKLTAALMIKQPYCAGMQEQMFLYRADIYSIMISGSMLLNYSRF